MYIPSHFQMKDVNEAFALIENYPFADLITCLDGKLEINHAPFLLSEDRKFLLTHLAKNNEHCQQVVEAKDLRVCFHGPDAYISPGWYSDPKNVPTWNYQTVQVTGTASILTSDETIKLLDKLSQKHEARFEQPWTLDKLPQKKLDAMVNAIVGIKISIEDISGKAKLSQNKNAEQIGELIEGLEKQGSYESRSVADLMRLYQKPKPL